MTAETSTYFVLVRATPAWLNDLSRDQRFAFFEAEIKPIFGRYPGARMRFFDAEAYTSVCSDVMMFEVTDQRHYRLLIDELRDTPLFGRPYFEVVHIIPCVEDAYQEQDRVHGGPDRSRTVYDDAAGRPAA